MVSGGFRLAAGGFGWLRVVSDGFGWFAVLVVTNICLLINIKRNLLIFLVAISFSDIE